MKKAPLFQIVGKEGLSFKTTGFLLRLENGSIGNFNG